MLSDSGRFFGWLQLDDLCRYTPIAWEGRIVALGSWQFVVLLAFGLLNLAVVSRVIFPGEKAA